MQPYKNPSQSEKGHELAHEWPSTSSTSTHDRAFEKRPFEVEPAYLPGPQDRSFGTDHGVSPGTSFSRRSAWTEAPDNSEFSVKTAGGKPSDPCFEMQGLGKSPPPPPAAAAASSRQQVLYREVCPGEVTPYPGLRARLTQVPINRWTVLLFLVLVRMLILFGTINTDLGDARSDALSACDKVSQIQGIEYSCT